MKKLWIAAIIMITFLGCGEDIRFNSPSLQGIKDGVTLWKADFYAADIDNGGLIIEGGNNGEILTLVCTNDNIGTYELGGVFQSEARFVDAQGITYSTLNNPDESVSLYPSEGQIVINSFDQTDNSVSGTYRFNAYSNNGLQSVNFIEGEFYRIPLSGGIDVEGGGVSCNEAITNVATAAEAFANTDSTQPDYSDICNAYKTALEVQIISCGDPVGAAQAIIDFLGDCN